MRYTRLLSVFSTVRAGDGDLVRTFCMNPHGHVVMENTDGIVTVNGHSYSDPKPQSHNTNFALLVSNRFTEPFNEPHQYGKRIASFSNMLGGGIMYSAMVTSSRGAARMRIVWEKALRSRRWLRRRAI